MFTLYITDKPYHRTATLKKAFRKVFCNFQVIFVIGLTLGIQVLLLDYYSESGSAQEEEQGNVLYYGRTNLQVHFADFAKSAIYYLAVKPSMEYDQITGCSNESFKVHDRAGLDIRPTGLHQTLGDTNVHAVSGFLDDRLSGEGQKFIRIISVGLYPGPSKQLYCSYDCSSTRFCSSPVSGVLLPAGTHNDYKQDPERKSLLDLHFLVCPVRSSDNPTSVSLTTRPCGYSHNTLTVRAFNTQQVVTPPRDIAVCVRPTISSTLGSTDKFPVWLEYLRFIGIDQVYMYISGEDSKFNKMLDLYSKETFKIVTTSDWTVMDREMESVISAEAAIMDCIYKNMMNFDNILIISYPNIPLLSAELGSIKQLVISDWFGEKIDEYGGFKVHSVADVSGGVDKPSSFIVRPRKLLGTAGNHFISLTQRPHFHALDAKDVRVDGVNSVDDTIMEQIKMLVDRKMKTLDK